MQRWFEKFKTTRHYTRLGWAALFCVGILSGILVGMVTGVPQTSEALPETATGLRERPMRIAGEVIAERPIPVPPPPIGPDPVEPETQSIVPAARFDRPRIAVVVDDLGLDLNSFVAANNLPGPVTLAFLPYGEGAQAMVDRVKPVHEVMLHLPMEPTRRLKDAGPDVLMTGQDAAVVKDQLAINLGKISGYAGVNNHTGSRFTADPDAMFVVLEELDRRGLYFVDSMTVNAHVASAIGRRRGWRVEERDVFLDSGGPTVSVESVKAQLAEAEEIARQNGHAVVIGHPYDVTMDVLGPWLLTAEARGFDLVTVSELFVVPTGEDVAGIR
ncbi:divergent polysaccharide deacetylase family protein [Parvularcula sp. LCG005]|uniref:divergent polysaccharide deacetylase family protein n=1 Tax=Parvularcula sp. LCG005 TaxID=3078805 RepID=UPI0029430785|nr:divergent polysaccharide deacetylase family protein [Parvularcula sp. LCG005]WOI52081.1 divergent polysaccharide deacetylase family protein [Parvularcula sp. LCG005]